MRGQEKIMSVCVNDWNILCTCIKIPQWNLILCIIDVNRIYFKSKPLEIKVEIISFSVTLRKTKYLNINPRKEEPDLCAENHPLLREGRLGPWIEIWFCHTLVCNNNANFPLPSEQGSGVCELLETAIISGKMVKCYSSTSFQEEKEI